MWEIDDILFRDDRSPTKVFYKITDPEFLGKYYWWSHADIESYHCTEDGCQERATHYLDDPVDGLTGFYCQLHGQPHAVYLRLSK
jgi:hypothetical protein